MAVITKLGLHKNQRVIYNDPARFKLVCASRRFGKSRLLYTSVITKALGFNGYYDEASPPSIVVIANARNQCVDLHWQPLFDFFDGKPYVSNIDKQNKEIRFYGNKPRIILRGCDDDGSKLRGLKIYYAAVDEIQQIKKPILDEVIFPAMADSPGSQFLGIGTPKGKINTLYFLKQIFDAEPDSAFFHFTAFDNPHFPLKEIERQRQTLSDRTFRQEFLAEFVDFPGKIFTEFDESRNLFSFDSSSEDLRNIYVSIDPGVNNAAVVLFSATQDLKFKVIKTFYSNETLTVNDLIRKVQDFASLAGEWGSGLKRIYVPDDREDLVYSLRQSGFAQALLAKRSNPGPKVRVELTNNLFKQRRVLVERKETDFIEEIQSYHRDTDGNGEVVDKIADGQKDHRIDSLLYGIGRICYQNKQLFKDLELAQNAIS